MEIFTDVDNKEVSIGEKRDRMYGRAKGLFTVMIDDDDRVADNYVESVYAATLGNVDCIGYQEECRINGRLQFSDFSLRYAKWESLRKPDGKFSYRRTPFFKTPIRTEICRSVGVKDMRFGEDEDFANRIRPHLQTQAYINQVMYYYSWRNLSEKEHNQRYGIQSK